MKKISISICVFTLFLGCKSTYLNSWNKSIQSAFPHKGKLIFIPPIKVRNDLIKQNYLSFVDKSEYSFVLEDYDFPSETYYGSIWNKKKKFSYSYQNGEIIEKDSVLFKGDIYKLVSKWDTTKIKTESEINYNRATPNHFITAYKISKLGNKFVVKRLVFKPF